MELPKKLRAATYFLPLAALTILFSGVMGYKKFFREPSRRRKQEMQESFANYLYDLEHPKNPDLVEE